MTLTCSPSPSTVSLRFLASLLDVQSVRRAMDEYGESYLVDQYHPRRGGRCPFLPPSGNGQQQHTAEVE